MQDWVFRLGSDNILGRFTSLSFLICEFANLCICILQSQLSSFTSLNPLQISQFVGILSGGNTYFHLPIAVSRDIYETFIFVSELKKYLVKWQVYMTKRMLLQRYFFPLYIGPRTLSDLEIWFSTSLTLSFLLRTFSDKDVAYQSLHNGMK